MKVTKGIITSYGLGWRTDQLVWTSEKGHTHRLVGTRDKYFIDFRLQTALYVLYGSGDGRSQLDYRYVGITHEGKSVRGLGQRLGEHASDQEKRGKWDRVNWFGFRKVIFEGKSPVGSLGPEVWRNETPIRIKDVIRDLEAVLSRLPGSTQALSNLKYAQEWKQLPLAELSHYRKLKRLLKGHDGATARLAKSVGIVAATRS